MEREKICVHRTENQNGLRDLEDDGECLESAQKEWFTAVSFTRGPLSVRRIEGHFQARLVSDTRLPGTLPQEATSGGSPTGKAKEDGETRRPRKQETGFQAHEGPRGPPGWGEWRRQGCKATWPPDCLSEGETSPKMWIKSRPDESDYIERALKQVEGSWEISDD